MGKEPLRITAIQQDKLMVILRRSGSREVSSETIVADIEAGAPVNEDGTINMVEYAAWVCARLADGATAPKRK